MTLLVIGYSSKKELKASVGENLKYVETSFFGPEYKSNGTFAVAHRPSLGYHAGREFFANVTMKNDKIEKVE
jgi:hypothetical protein